MPRRTPQPLWVQCAEQEIVAGLLIHELIDRKVQHRSLKPYRTISPRRSKEDASSHLSTNMSQRRLPKRKERSFTAAIIHHKPSWTVWRCWPIGRAWQRFIASKGSKKRRCANGCNEPPST